MKDYYDYNEFFDLFPEGKKEIAKDILSNMENDVKNGKEVKIAISSKNSDPELKMVMRTLEEFQVWRHKVKTLHGLG